MKFLKQIFYLASFHHASRNDSFRQRGSAMIEFAIVVPMLGVLILGLTEYTKLFKTKEFQSLITREAGSVVYRYCFQRQEHDCVTEDLLAQYGNITNNNFEACLTEWRTQVEEHISANKFLDGVDLTITFWQWDAGAPRFLAGSTKTSGRDQDLTRSHYYGNEAQVNTDFGDMLENNEVVVVAESFVDFDFSLINLFVPSGGDRYFDSLGLYHASVY